MIPTIMDIRLARVLRRIHNSIRRNSTRNNSNLIRSNNSTRSSRLLSKLSLRLLTTRARTTS